VARTAIRTRIQRRPGSLRRRPAQPAGEPGVGQEKEPNVGIVAGTPLTHWIGCGISPWSRALWEAAATRARITGRSISILFHLRCRRSPHRKWGTSAAIRSSEAPAAISTGAPLAAAVARSRSRRVGGLAGAHSQETITHQPPRWSTCGTALSAMPSGCRGDPCLTSTSGENSEPISAASRRLRRNSFGGPALDHARSSQQASAEHIHRRKGPHHLGDRQRREGVRLRST